MKQIKRIPITKEGFERLKQELEVLKAERPQAVKTLAEARSMGDLSENGLYTSAKSRLRSMDSQIFRLESQIKLADIIVEGSSGVAKLGSKVNVKQDGILKTFYIVGDYEANPVELKVSQYSPIGRALMGKKSGQTAYFEAPKGRISFEILDIS